MYRWQGTDSYHGSQFSENEHQAVGEYVQQELQAGRLAVGAISLTPLWHADYVTLVREHLEPHPVADSTD